MKEIQRNEIIYTKYITVYHPQLVIYKIPYNNYLSMYA